MAAEPSEWHAFGDPPELPALKEGVQPSPAGSRGAAGPSAVAMSHRRAWIAVGATILAAIVGVVVFVTTVAMAMGGHASDVVIAARHAATPPASAPALLLELSSPDGGALLLLVDVEGAVRSPGLHQVPTGSRVGDAITAAGGYADRADLVAAAGSINLAAPLADGAKIRVPLLGETDASAVDGGPRPSSAPASNGTGPVAGLIDLNHADESALEGLPGIGPVTAAKIIAARESTPFASVDDVVTRKALSASVLDKIRSLVTVTP